jgi:hypothetical protein
MEITSSETGCHSSLIPVAVEENQAKKFAALVPSITLPERGVDVIQMENHAESMHNICKLTLRIL